MPPLEALPTPGEEVLRQYQTCLSSATRAMVHGSIGAASVRNMMPAALDDFFASKIALKPLVGTLARGVDGGLLVGLIEDLLAIWI